MDVDNAQSKYQKPYEEASNLVDNCQLAQTSVGSYIFNIKMPLRETYLKIGEGEEYLKDLGRRTIIRILSGIKEAKDLTTLGDEAIFKENYDKKLNKNTCDAIKNLITGLQEITIQMGAKWDKLMQLDTLPPENVNITHNDKERFEKMSDYLKDIQIAEEKVLVGEIKKLWREGNIETIIIYDNKLKRNVYIELKHNDYITALEIHKNRSAIITIKGILDKEGIKWVLRNYREFNQQMFLKQN